MKKILFLLLSFLTPSLLFSQTPNICGVFYAVTGNTAYISSFGVPNSSTLVPIAIPPGANGMALGSPFGFSGPNPTLWTIIGGTYWYFNGTTFIDSNHGSGPGAINPGGSANFIYNLAANGVITKYNGTGNATAVGFIPPGSSYISDIAGDDKDNYYLMRLQPLPVIEVYNSSGVLTCTFSTNGISSATTGSALAILDNSVAVQTNNGYYTGLISGTAINFTQTAASFTGASDFANCPRLTPFPSTITALGSSSITCTLTAVSLSATSLWPYAVSAYTWSGPGIQGSSSGAVAQASVPGVYTCTLTTCEGGSSTATYTVFNAVTTPTVLASVSVNTVCAGSGTTLHASGAISYTWLPSGSNGNQHTVTPSSNTTYTVVGSDASGCLDFDTVSVYLIQIPTVSAQITPTSLCSGGSATLSAGGSATSYSWLPGSLSGSNLVVNPGSTTIYTVVGALGSCTAAATTTIINPSSPSLVVSGTSLTCNTPSLTFIVLKGSIHDTISWSGPGIVSPNSSTLLNVSTPGFYKLIVNDTVANCLSVDSINVVNAMQSVLLNVVPSATHVCFPGTDTVKMLINTPASCVWAPPVFLNTSNGPLVLATPSITTTYTITGVLGVCNGTTAITLSVDPKPVLSTTLSSIPVCEGNTVQAIVSGAGTYTWLPGNLVDDTVYVKPNATTVYTVIGRSGECYSSDTVRIKITPAPYFNTSLWPVLICPGQSSTLMATGALDYTWAPGGMVNVYSVAVSPTITTVYTVTANSGGPCNSTSLITVSVYNAPVINAVASETSICLGDSLLLSASGALSYTWAPGNLTGSSVVVYPGDNTVYTAMTANSVCITRASVSVNVNDCGPPAFGVSNAAGTPVRDGNDQYRIDFTVTAVNESNQPLYTVRLDNDLKKTFTAPASYTVISPPVLISKGSGLKVNPYYDGITVTELLTPSASFLPQGRGDTLVFAVRVDPRGLYGLLRNQTIGNAYYYNGRLVSDTSNNGFKWDPDLDGNPANNSLVTYINLEPIDLFIPEGFSPNGDGIHDYFVISGLNGRPVKLTVFNRWGNKVYEKDRYENNWDGVPNVSGVTFGNGKLPASTYYYILQFQDGRKEIKTGFVVIID